jgi:hypothetical protein
MGVVGCCGAFLDAQLAVAGKDASGCFFAWIVGVADRGFGTTSESYVKISSLVDGAGPSTSSPGSCANVQLSFEHRAPLRYVGQYLVMPHIARSLLPSLEKVPSVAAMQCEASDGVR